MNTAWENLSTSAQEELSGKMLEAARRGDVDYIEAMLDAGVPATMRSNNGAGLVHFLVWEDMLTPGLIRKLESAGASVDDQTNIGETPLHWEVAEGNIMGIWRMLKLGANPNVPTNAGDLSAHFAATRGDAGILRALAMAGARFDVPNHAGKLPRDLVTTEKRADVQACFNEFEQWYEAQQILPDAVKNAKTVPELLACFSGSADRPSAPIAAWEAFPEALAALCAKGESVTTEMVHATEQKGGSGILQEAAKSFALPRVVEALNAQGVQLGGEFLLAPDGGLTLLGEVLTASGDIASLFTEDNWEGQHLRDLRGVLDALPDAARNQITNTHQLTASLSRQKRGVER